MDKHTYEAKDYSDLCNLKALSRHATDNHIKLYEGYVKKLNEINEELKTVNIDSANHNYSHHRSLTVEKTYNYNAIVLHELFFENLTHAPCLPDEDFIEIIEDSFKSFDEYLRDLAANAKSSRAGWAFSAYNHKWGKIKNYAIDSHSINIPIDVTPILVIDTWEHAFILDYDVDKAKYIDAVLQEINWHIVFERLKDIRACFAKA